MRDLVDLVNCYFIKSANINAASILNLLQQFANFRVRKYNSLEEAQGDIISIMSAVSFGISNFYPFTTESGQMIYDIGYQAYPTIESFKNARLGIKWEKLPDGQYSVRPHLLKQTREPYTAAEVEKEMNKEKAKLRGKRINTYPGPYTRKPQQD